MSILIFVVVLVVLILVHELGHFVVAKLSGMRVDEFGLGYPPRALVLGTKGDTVYTLNWLPFGGFVKIHGEDDTGTRDSRAFSAKPRHLQALVLVAGIAMNLLLAYLLITAALMLGTPRALSQEEVGRATDVQLGVLQVLPGTPAAESGIRAGDAIVSAERGAEVWIPGGAESFPAFVAASEGEEITLSVERDGEVQTLSARPARLRSTYVLGVEVATIGVVSLSFGEAFVEGADATWHTILFTAEGLFEFFASIFTLSADLSAVAGPIGIAGVVGSASAQGFSYLLSITALISINLALINLIPIPALDGGRLLFVLIESVTRRPIKASIAQGVNAVGFFLLILLMIVVSIHDVFNIIVG